jgi:Spy/CpxP family protein refolding chaperone
MIKKCILVLLAAGIIAMAVPFAAAQGNDAKSAPPPPQDNGGRHHGPFDPAQRTQELTKKLKLTSDQQTKVQSILESEHSQMESLRQDSSVSQQDRHGKMMDIHQTSDSQIRALLDPTQQKKWDEMQAKHGQWGHNHGQGSGDQQGPPPQE